MNHHMANGMPTFIYGTAWKEDRTAALVRMALEAGFRGIDTANQRRHYREAAVGEALARAFNDGLVTRNDLFLQTKFTHPAGQDHRLPYDPGASPTLQVEQSFESSLEHLGVDVLDAFLLHGPSYRDGWAPVDLEVWRAMEAVQRSGRVRWLGVSNVSSSQLEELCAHASIPPALVQNRCFAQFGWDRAVREVCRSHDLVYQGFSLLTANAPVIMQPEFRRIVERTHRFPAQVIFRFALQVGIVPLTGTSSPQHARDDLKVFTFELTEDEVATIDRLFA
jgi:diketogulonate reductase-like aldo/keto reductase